MHGLLLLLLCSRQQFFFLAWSQVVPVYCTAVMIIGIVTLIAGYHYF